MPLDTAEALTDLKLLPGAQQAEEGRLLLCFTAQCRICPISLSHPPSPQQCIFHQFDRPAQSLRAALTPEGRLFLRPIYSPENAAVQAIDSRNGRIQAVDYEQIREHRVVAGFNWGAYVYFVGSANRVDMPESVDKKGKARQRTDIRLTRVCQGDTSQLGDGKGLESRMELVLSCRGLVDPLHKSAPQRTIAASQSADGKSLLVVIEREERNGEEEEEEPKEGRDTEKRTLVCRFGMAEMEAAFDNLWDTCQTVESNKWQQKECEGPMDSPQCFMFSWELEDDRYSLCRKFGQGGQANCQLNSTRTLAYRAGWLENFKPTLGQIMAELAPSESSPIVAIEQNAGGEAFTVAFQNGTIQRFGIDGQQGVQSSHQQQSQLANPIWTIPGQSTEFGPFGMAMDPMNGNLLFARANEVNLLEMDCAGMYPKCEQIFWSDPLQCRWCHFANSTGRTIGRIEGMEECQGRGGLLLDTCPPEMTEVTREEGGMITIWGKRLNSVEKPRIDFCGKPCQLDKQSMDTIRCKMSSLPSDSCHHVSLEGKFGSVPNIQIDHDLRSKGERGNENGIHQSYIYRVVLVICAVLLISLALIVIYCSLYPKYAQRLLKLAFFRSGRGTSSDIATSTYRPIPSTDIHHHHHNPIQNAFPPSAVRNPFASSSTSPWRSGCGHSRIEDGIFGIENLVVTLADGSQLDQGTFECIGEGYFSKVCRAVCRQAPEDEKGYFVAVKIIKNASSLAEIKQEVAMISKCRHPNIVQYIDHFVSEMGLIHICIEYMGGGDLHRFLMDWRNMPTLGDAFSYILQIADGMAYLTEQRIVHRDLAARNCMLDSDHEVVKITDFGLSRVLTKSKLMGEHEDNYVYIYVSENQQQQLPYRWTAIECFCADPLFSEKTDVWAFGVLVWEIFARNRVPYEEMKSQEVKRYLEGGGRLEQMMHCPGELYELMKQCWDADPGLRPTFRSIWPQVKGIFDDLMAKDAEYMNTEYEPLAPSEYEAPKIGPSVSGSGADAGIRSSSSTATTRAGDATVFASSTSAV